MDTKKEAIVTIVLNFIILVCALIFVIHPAIAGAETAPEVEAETETVAVETYSGMSTEDAISEKIAIKAFLAANEIKEKTTEEVITEESTTIKETLKENKTEKTEIITEKPTEPVTEKVTEPVPEKVTKPVVEEKTTELKNEEEPTESVIEKESTEEKATEEVTEEQTTESKPVTYPSKLLTPCGYTEEQLRNALLHDLKDCAGYFLEAEATYGVNATFLAAIAAVESAWGQSNLAKTKNNLYGWKGNGSYKYFDSTRDCIMHVAKSLKTNYLSPDGPYFRGYTIEAVNVYYCGSSQWVSMVSGIMRQINNRAI